MKRHILCVVIAIGWGVMSIPALAFNLSPHQAIYQMSLDGASSKSGISGAEGAMMYKFEESCEAWTSETKVYLKLLYTEGDPLETTWSFVSWEAKDGLNYRFRVHQSRNGTPVEKIQGNVSRDSINGVAEAKFTSPEGTFIDLPEGTMFPTHHLQKLIEEGESGTLTFSRTVFDGASLDNPYKINALITAISKSSKKNTTSETGQGKHVRMAFFPFGSRKEFPEFELGIDYRPDGIADHILQDFGDFRINLVPNKIEILDRPIC